MRSSRSRPVPRVILNVMTSLDGFFSGPNGELDWHYADDEHNAYAVRMMKRGGAILFGATTYRMMAGHWPTAPEDDPVTRPINAAQKFVFSKRLKTVSWNNTTLLRGSLKTDLARLKKSVAGDLVVLGSAKLANSLLTEGLLDEVQLLVCPIFLGKGKPLFKSLTSPAPMELVGTHTRASGVVEMTYRPLRGA